jgi:hypothetical protein
MSINKLTSENASRRKVFHDYELGTGFELPELNA